MKQKLNTDLVELPNGAFIRRDAVISVSPFPHRSDYWGCIGPRVVVNYGVKCAEVISVETYEEALEEAREISELFNLRDAGNALKS